MSDPTQTIWGHERVRTVLFAVLTALVAAVRTAIMLMGTITVLLVDIAIGACALSQMFHHNMAVNIGFTTITVSAALLAFLISASTSSVQLALWDVIVRRKKQSYGTWCTMVVLVGLDTLLDVSAVGYLMYGKLPTHVFVDPAQQTPLYWIAVGIVGLLAMCDSYYVYVLLQHLRKDYGDTVQAGPRKSFSQAVRDALQRLRRRFRQRGNSV